MAASAHRLLVTNRFQASTSTRSASSTNAAFAVSWLLDQMRSKVWRSATGWTIVAGDNDKIDFDRGGVLDATIAPGTYATAAALCAAIVTALQAADATPVWACTYSGTTFKFTISADMAFELLLNSGANVAAAVWIDLGYSTAADTGSATSHVAGTAVHQSRHWIKVDLGSALAVTASVAINHNLSGSGTITLQGNATDAWTSPSFSQALSTTMNETATSPAGRLAFFSNPGVRYFRFLINDVGNTAGFAEVGILYLGPYSQPAYNYSNSFRRPRRDLSAINKAVRGAHYQDQRPMQRLYGVQWSDFPDVDRAALEAALDLVPKGKNFFFAFDAVNDTANTVYLYFEEDVEVAVSSGDYWTIAGVMAEALG
jgi:hypothetical protein